MKSSCVSPKFNDWCPQKRRRGHRDREKDNVKMEAEIREIQLQAKEHKEGRQLLEAGRQTWMASLSQSSEETEPANTMISDFLPLEL